jgi:hypothetical protein
MGFPVRALAVLALVLVPVVASAQGAGGIPGTPGTPPPPGGGAAPLPPPGGGTDPGGAPADKKPADAKSSGNVGGVSFNDKPARRAAPRGVIRHTGGPLATFPGFEQISGGGSRLFVHLTQAVPVEERRATGSITYVLKGAHLRVHNDANALVTVHFNTPVFRARLFPQGNDLLFVLELRSAATPTFRVQPNQDKSATLQIDFAKGDFLVGDGRQVLPPEPGPRTKRGARGTTNTPGTPAPVRETDDSSDQGPPP